MSETIVTTETPAASADEATEKELQLPDDHPLVKSLAAQKAEIKALKEKASRLDQLEEAQKSAEEKAAERAAAAESRALEAESRATRREIALEYKLSKDDAELLDDVKDEDAMRRLAGRLAKLPEDKPKGGNYVSREGTNQTATADERRAFVRQLTGRE